MNSPAELMARPRWPVRLTQAAAQVRADLPLALLDAALVAAVYLAVLLLRFEGAVPSEWWTGASVFIPVAVASHLAANWVWGLYGQMWLHASVQEARRVALACVSAGLCLTGFTLSARHVPLSVALLGSMLSVVVVGAVRFHARLFALHRNGDERQTVRVVVIGAGESGGAIIREMLRNPHEGLLPVAVLDDDPSKQGRAVAGVPVLGGIERLAEASDHFRAHQALLAIPSADSGFVRLVANAADAVGLTLKVLPRVSELVGGQLSARDVRDLSIGDLLGRNQVVTDLASVRRILEGRCVLVTGAGGSIGSEIARQVSVCRPARLLLLDHDETHLHEAAASLIGASEQLLADVRDRALIDALVARHRPDVIFHAAAHKHVPLLEAHPCEAVATNVVGTENVVAAAARHGVERLVFLSTDKAVRPSSVMGASKRLGEQLVLTQAPPGARYCAVRFGNVLASRGSVIPTFMRQIAQGGPVTVTDARMTRFFMSIEEAVQLVLQAAAFADGGEVFMLEMGEPVPIIELAERMIRLSGRRVGVDVPIRIVGPRPGEKLEEELRAPEEQPEPTPHPSIVALRPAAFAHEELVRGLEQLTSALGERDEDAARSLLFALATRPGSELRIPEAVIDLSADPATDRSPSWNPSST